MSTKNQLPVSIRNFRARLRPLRQPIVWGTVIFLGVFTLFSWELWSNPEQFANSELTSDTETSGEDDLSQEASAIAADIDSSSVLEEDMKQLETPAPVVPMTSFKPAKPSQDETSDPSTFTTPAATLPNSPSPGLGNIFLSGNGSQVQIDDVLSTNQPGNQINNNSSGNGINLWWDDRGMNSRGNTINNNVSSQDNSPSTISPLQAAIMRRSITSNPSNSAPTGSSQNVTATSAASESQSATVGNRLPAASTQGNNQLLETPTNQSNSGTDPTANTAQTPTNLDLTGQVMPNAQLIMPLSPTSSGVTNSYPRGYNLDRQSAPSNSTMPNNSYQYLLQSGQSNSVTGTSVNGAIAPQIVNPRTAPSLRTPTTTRTFTQPLPSTNLGNSGTVNSQNSGTIVQPSVPVTTQPDGQNPPSLRSVEVPQSAQTNIDYSNQLTNGGANSNLSSPGQTLQSAPTYTVPRPIPGRYIGGGQINTFSNP